MTGPGRSSGACADARETGAEPAGILVDGSLDGHRRSVEAALRIWVALCQVRALWRRRRPSCRVGS
jgi:hypothetical protein